MEFFVVDFSYRENGLLKCGRIIGQSRMWLLEEIEKLNGKNAVSVSEIIGPYDAEGDAVKRHSQFFGPSWQDLRNDDD